jgi:hypothetical protein
MSAADRGLLDALVGWWDLVARSWPMHDAACWQWLVDEGYVAFAPENRIYPLPRGISFIHRSNARLSKDP